MNDFSYKERAIIWRTLIIARQNLRVKMHEVMTNPEAKDKIKASDANEENELSVIIVKLARTL